MKITNSKGKIICKECKECKSIWSKGRGLMFTKKIKPLIMEFKKEQKVSLHMGFVFYPIDVIYLNDKFKVVELKERFKPFTIYNPKNKAKYIMELEEGKIQKNKIKVGDTFIKTS